MKVLLIFVALTLASGFVRPLPGGRRGILVMCLVTATALMSHRFA